MAESPRLLSVYRVKPIAGSNPALSAGIKGVKPSLATGLFLWQILNGHYMDTFFSCHFNMESLSD